VWPPGGRLADKVPPGHVPNYLYVGPSVFSLIVGQSIRDNFIGLHIASPVLDRRPLSHRTGMWSPFVSANGFSLWPANSQ